VEHPPVVVGNASGAEIDIQAFVEIASLLGCSVIRGFLSDHATVPGGEVAAAGTRLGLEHLALEAGTRQFVSCSQAGNARAQDEHGLIPA